VGWSLFVKRVVKAGRSVRARAPRAWADRRPIPRRHVARFAVLVMLVGIAAATFLAVTAVSLAREAPLWWRSVDPTSPATVRLADRVERAVLNAVHRHRPADVWSVSISPAQANAWLNVKLPRWIENRGEQWPEIIGDVQTHFENGRISVGVRLLLEGEEQIVAATVRPRLTESGALWLTGAQTRAGRLDLPAGWTVARLGRALPSRIRDRSATRRLLRAMQAEAPILDHASVELEDGRLVALRSVRIRDGRLELTCETTPAHYAEASNE